MSTTGNVSADFFRWQTGQERSLAETYWQSQFEGLRAQPFPALPWPSYSPRPDSCIHHTIQGLSWPAVPTCTTQLAILAAWAILQCAYTEGEEALVGRVVDVKDHGAAVVPARIAINQQQMIPDLLAQLSRQATEALQHEGIGLEHVSQFSEDTRRACMFQTMLAFGRDLPSQIVHTSGCALVVNFRNASSESLSIDLHFDKTVMTEERVVRMLVQFEHVLKQLSELKMSVSDISTATEHDYSDMRRWNSGVVKAVEECVHDRIAKVTEQNKSAKAIDAWDGTLSYAELDWYATTLATRLVGHEYGLQSRCAVLLAFEKSKWASVAMLAVMKAGAVSTMIDPKQPVQRLAHIAKQTGARHVLVSASVREGLAAWVSPSVTVVTVDDLFYADYRPCASSSTPPTSTPAPTNLPICDPSDPLCMVFTSGSTGLPKGVILSHTNFSSALPLHRELFGITQSSRIYDFISYSFDFAWSNLLLALSSGACLCVPSNAARESDVALSIQNSQATFLCLTPTLALSLDLSACSELDCVVLGGEKLSWSPTLATLVQQLSVFHVYGPAECTVLATSTRLRGEDDLAGSSIGKSLGSALWITHPENPKQLQGVGCVGELWIQGPLVGQGYIGDRMHADSPFTLAPPWEAADPHCEHREVLHYSCYGTGDLCRFRMDGTLEIMGRRDAQVKVRGQRVDLGEIERHSQSILLSSGLNELHATAESITPNDHDHPLVVLFLTPKARRQPTEREWQETVWQHSGRLLKLLEPLLPAFMLPAACLPVLQLPMTNTGKTDRRRVRMDFSGKLSMSDMLSRSCPQAGVARHQVETGAQTWLQQLWAKVLNVPTDTISADSTFLELGGDSVRAMQVTAQARRAGVMLQTGDLLKGKPLDELAGAFADHPITASPCESLPFGLLPLNVPRENLRKDIANACNVSEAMIEDALPCTPLQEGLLAMTALSSSAYTTCIVLDLPPDVDIGRLRRAWRSTVQHVPMLRTRMVESLDCGGLVQVVLSDSEIWEDGMNLASYLDQQNEPRFGLGTLLCRAALVADEKQHDRPVFILTLHHALYDGWSLPRVLKHVEDIYYRRQTDEMLPIQGVIRHVQAIDYSKAAAYWTQYFAGMEATHFPPAVAPSHRPQADSVVVHHVPAFPWPHSKCTVAVGLQAAWALLQSAYAGSNEACFGLMLSGRRSHIEHVERIVAPTLTTVPRRIMVSERKTLASLIDDIQQQETDVEPYEQIGLQKIRTMSAEAQQACEFQNLLLIQPEESEFASDLFTLRSTVDDDLHQVSKGTFNSYTLLVECLVRNPSRGRTGLEIRLSFDKRVLEPKQLERMARQLEFVVAQISTLNLERPLCEIQLASPADMEEIALWNTRCPVPVRRCVHDLVSEIAKEQPRAIAVSAWDGELTYEALERKATNLAKHIQHRCHSKPRAIIALCMSKSMWVPVAMLAVMKSGCAAVLLDVEQPLERLRKVSHQSGCKLVLCSSTFMETAKQLGVPNNVAVELFSGCDSDSLSARPLRPVHPSDPLYLVFTSGSTGTPKGVMILHENIATAVRYQAGIIGQGPGVRALDWASYAYDVAWATFLFAVTSGATLCIPSADQKKADLAVAIQDMRVNHIGLTPSVLQTLEPTDVPLLTTVIVAGEPLTSVVVQRWASAVSLKQLYGPAECSIAVAGTNVDISDHPQDLGSCLGVNAWIVQDGSKLAAIGTIGELWLEGPLVGNGYLNDSSQTLTSFVKSPAWLKSSGLSPERRQSIFYRTGDHVRYTMNGGLRFIGRKDEQVKVRGQRVELGEVESHLILAMPSTSCARIAVETVVPHGSEHEVIVAFIQVDGVEKMDMGEARAAIRDRALLAKRRLAFELPTSMVPFAYVPISSIPQTNTGKRDRRKLKDYGSRFTAVEMSAFLEDLDTFEPVTAIAERELRGFWASLLCIDPETIGRHDNFIKLGGDSVIAMRLTASTRRSHWHLPTIDVLMYPTLADMATRMVRASEDGASSDSPSGSLDPAAFALLTTRTDMNVLQEMLASTSGVEAGRIQDAIPCTALQEALLALTERRPHAYVAKLVFKVPAEVDLNRLKAAVHNTVTLYPILRARAMRLVDGQLIQAILSTADTPECFTGTVAEVIREHFKDSMSFGDPLSSFAWIEDKVQGDTYLAWKIHHSLYDDWTMSRIHDSIQDIYHGSVPPPVRNYSAFVKFSQDANNDEARTFWRNYFAGFQTELFPPTPDVFQAQADRSLRRTFPQPRLAGATFTLATLLRTAWAVVMARHLNENDVVFGTVSSGREGLEHGLEHTVGPTITTYPSRIRLDDTCTLLSVLNQVQEGSLQAMKYEQIGLKNIRRVSAEAGKASKFQTLVIVHSRSERRGGAQNSRVLEPIENVGLNGSAQMGSFDPYALTIEFLPKDQSSLEICVSYDSRVCDVHQLDSMLDQLQRVLRLVETTDGAQIMVGDIDMVPQQDMRTIWRWNADVPLPVSDDFVHDMISKQADRRPYAPAVEAWDGKLSYRDLDSQTTAYASYLRSKELQPNEVVLIYLEKSLWVPVAALSVMKTGATCLLLDVSQPDARLQVIANEVNPSLVITSKARHDHARTIAPCAAVLTIDESYSQHTTFKPTILQDVLSPSETFLYIVYTSGTTGGPKGIGITHTNFSSAIKYQQEALAFNEGARVLDAASYAFDASWSNLLHTLAAGGCICIPVPDPRLLDFVADMNRYRITYADLTPSVGRTVDFSCVPTLKTLVFGGEVLRKSDVERYDDSLNIINTFGPCECTVVVTAAQVDPHAVEQPSIGKGLGVVTWVVDPQSPQRLQAIGCIGELYIEGPLVSQGYWHNSAATEAAFIDSPAWLRSGFESHKGREARLYRTGDLVRYKPDGSLQYIGRKDTQVKIRGQRLELDEVEHHVSSILANSADCAATTARLSANLEGVVVLIAPRGSTDMTTAERDAAVAVLARKLEDLLPTLLPSFMVPLCYVPSSPFPRGPNGKRDRKAIQVIAAAYMEQQRLHERSAARPETTHVAVHSRKDLVRKAWSEVLDMAPDMVPLNVPFSQLGDSITAMRLAHICRLRGLPFHMPALLSSETVETMSKRVVLDEVEVVSRHNEVGKTCILAPIQQWHFAAHPKGINHYNQAIFVEVALHVDLRDLTRAIQQVARQHPMLRARFHRCNDVWTQKVLPLEDEAFDVCIHTVSDMSKLLANAAMRQEELDILNGPVFRADVLVLPKQHVLLLTAHHLCVDIVSWAIILGDLEQCLGGQPLSNESSSRSFMAWCKVAQEQALLTAPRSAIPFDLPAPDLQYWTGPDSINTYRYSNTIRATLDQDTSAVIFHATCDLGPLDLMLAALLESFRRAFPDRDLPLLTLEGHGRDALPLSAETIDVSSTVGWFTSFFPVVVGDLGPRDLLGIAKLIQQARTSVPDHGREYFNARYYHPAGPSHLGDDHVAELMFNYEGQTPVLGNSPSALLRRFDGPAVPNQISPDAVRPAIFDISACSIENKLSISFTWPERCKRLDRVMWWRLATLENLKALPALLHRRAVNGHST